jgi:Ca-activated chloride channel homolog
MMWRIPLLILLLMPGCLATFAAGEGHESLLAQWRPAQPPQQPPAAASPQDAQVQEPEAVFRAGVTMVQLDVQILDQRRTITGLTRDDFLVFDEGQPQPIQYFGHGTDPLDLLLLLDVSGSVTRHLEEIARTAREALAQLRSGDRVGVMVFARRSQLTDALTAATGTLASSLRERVRHKDLGAGTDINPAIIAAAGYLDSVEARGEAGGSASNSTGTQPENTRRRRTILIVTDNQSLHYQSPDEEAIRALYQADAVLYAIVVGRGDRPKPPRPGEYRNPDFSPADVFKIAEATGGEAVKSRDAASSFRDMVERIRSRYFVGYTAPQATPGTFRRVEVRLTPEAAKRLRRPEVRVRAGYYAEE